MVVALLRVHDAARFTLLPPCAGSPSLGDRASELPSSWFRGHARRDALSALTGFAAERVVWSLLIFNKDQIG